MFFFFNLNQFFGASRYIDDNISIRHLIDLLSWQQRLVLPAIHHVWMSMGIAMRDAVGASSL